MAGLSVPPLPPRIIDNATIVPYNSDSRHRNKGQRRRPHAGGQALLQSKDSIMPDTKRQITTLDTLDTARAGLPARGARSCFRCGAREPRRGCAARAPGRSRELHPGVGRPVARALATLPAADAPPGDRTGTAHRARRPARQGTARQLQPQAGRLQRTPLPESGTAAGRPRPGGHAGAHQGQREVRLAQGLSLLDIRDALDSPGDPARPRELRAHDPAAGARRAAHPQGRSCRARAIGAPRARAHGRGDRDGDGPPSSSRSRKCAISVLPW